jgi:4-hydroxybenzoate polyprenyltransferase/phosphoserine phosphatase
MAANPTHPLCIDCDGTLIRTDLLHESLIALLKTQPLQILLLPLWLLRGKAHVKQQIAQRVQLDARTLPYNEAVLERIREARAQGRTTVLATASTHEQAEAVQAHLQLFDRIEASSPELNLSGEHKAKRLADLYGQRGFDYAGNSAADIPVWQQSAGAIVVEASGAVQRAASASAPVIATIERPRRSLKVYVKAIRAHQWLKNLLVFVPLMASHRFTDGDALVASVLAFFAFGFSASAVYIVNDLLDLPSDRQHRRKRHRPFASGVLPVSHGLAMLPVLLIGAFVIASFLPVAFALTLVVYLLITNAYTFWLKNRVVVDVLVLALLYTSRLVAGATATGIVLSFWLLSFSIFLFFSLAIVKRYAELIVARDANKQELPGRGYVVADIPVMLSVGVSCGTMSVLVLALYINSPEVEAQYANKSLLWVGLPLALYWICRVWMKTHRGQMHDDPVVFAARDWQSWLVIAIAVLAASVAWLRT